MSLDESFPCSDEAVRARTGRGWEDWFSLIEREDGGDLSHRELARFLDDRHEAGGWWSQTIAVAYEQHTGRRAPHQEAGGSFRASASRTLHVDGGEVHRCFTDAEQRQKWIDVPLEIRHATPPKSVRISWPDGTDVAVWISAQGEGRCRVAVEHGRLPSSDDVPPLKTFWKDALGRLKAHLEEIPSSGPGG